jgi:exosortase D (VPLPA-CTERM-specific)
MNSVRIAITGLLVNQWGPSMAEGFLHDFEGWIIFLICASVIVLEIYILEKLTGGKSFSSAFQLQVRHTEAPQGRQWMTGIARPLMAFLPLMLISAYLLNQLDQREEEPLVATNLASFPVQFEHWQGTHHALDKEVLQTLGLTDYLMTDFVDEAGANVNFYVAYYESQRKGNSPHSPSVCIPGGGWEIADIVRTVIKGLPVNRVLIRKDQQSQLVYYWFRERGRDVANEYLKKWMLFEDAWRLNRTDGALIRVVTPIYAHEDISQADIRIGNFIDSTKDTLVNFLPDRELENI